MVSNSFNKFLSYLLNWPGLNTKLIAKHLQPSTEHQYYLKSRNWANGARTKEYSRGLYLYMIEKSVEYANTVVDYLISNPNQLETELKQNMVEIIIYTFLIQLLNTKVTIQNTQRRVNLVSANSLKESDGTVNPLRRLLQNYVSDSDHRYIDKFPAHREEAISYYTKAKSRSRSMIQCTFQRYYLQKLADLSTQTSTSEDPESIYNLMQFIRDIHNDTSTSDNNQQQSKERVIIDKNVWNVILSTIESTKKNIDENEIIKQHFQQREKNIEYAINTFGQNDDISLECGHFICDESELYEQRDNDLFIIGATED